jgi:proteasome alpha subunit
MSSPFYISPEQWYQEKAELARKGIARGRPIVALDYADGIVLAAENRSTRLKKLAEIYDRIAFAAVGKFDEYDSLRKAGVRYADLRGYSYSRSDVAAANLANEFSTVLGGIFTREMKPFEVELLVCEVGAQDGEPSAYFNVLFNGFISDSPNFASIGGEPDRLQAVLRGGWKEALALPEALRLARSALESTSEGGGGLGAESLEVAILDRRREGRKFRRFKRLEVRELLGG